MLTAIPLQNWRFSLAGPGHRPPATASVEGAAPAEAGGGSVPPAVAAALAPGLELAARVPGNVHDDLLAHGLLADPYLGRNELAAAWVGRQDWRYRTELPQLSPDRVRLDLVADGLDTFARVRLDGHQVARTCDQHRSYRWDVTELARDGAELTVDFESAYAVAARAEAAWGPYPAAYDEPFQYVRKMASNFGWDWGPTVVTAGIWRDLRLEAWDTARLAQVRPRPRLDSPTGQVGSVLIEVDLERATAGETGPVRVAAVLVDPAGRTVAWAERATARQRVELTLEAGPVQRWWPHDLGGQPLYRVEVELTEGSRRLDAWSSQIGFRQIELVAEPDQIGRSFGFTVAGRPVFAKGFNWIPDDLLVTRVTAQAYRARLAEAKAAGANLIRVWGGGLYEQDAFYEACDELGLMVWQDCPFACAAYPESDDFATQIEAETRDNVARLMPHPSLVLWNGCNENLWGYQDWDWQPVLDGRGWGERYYFDLLPRVIAELDPDRPYWPGSPYSGDRQTHPNDPDHGCSHSWAPWNETVYTDYAATRPRFVSEFGWCGPAAQATLSQAVGPERLALDDPVLLWHYKAQDGLDKLRRGLGDFHQPTDFDTWHYLTALKQARATQFGLDHWRSLWPRCQGALVWQLNDCWPVISWAAVDSAGRRKPVWHAIRQSFASRLAVLGTTEQAYQLKLVNNTDQIWSTQPLVRRVALADGSVRAAWSQPVEVGPGRVEVIDLPADLAGPPGPGQEPGRGLGYDETLLVDAAADRIDPASRRVWAQPDRLLELSRPAWRVETTAAPDPAGPKAEASLVRVTADSLVRDLVLQADRLGGVGESAPVTLLPGESYQWLVTGLDHQLTPPELVTPVLLDAASAELAARAG
ncbi:MAG: glycoside hydrolase family 2 protein [Propionibacteriaceae bacterium]|jgi:beta-mannosidase|nr:glycoside hydrolase family 2 protein [Propionibacteriaceae bacterium]